MTWQYGSASRGTNPNVPTNYLMVWSEPAKQLLDQKVTDPEQRRISLNNIEHDAYLRGKHAVTTPLLRRKGIK